MNGALSDMVTILLSIGLIWTSVILGSYEHWTCCGQVWDVAPGEVVCIRIMAHFDERWDRTPLDPESSNLNFCLRSWSMPHEIPHQVAAREIHQVICENGDVHASWCMSFHNPSLGYKSMVNRGAGPFQTSQYLARSSKPYMAGVPVLTNERRS
jgi:hypothetical protein